MCVLKQAAPNCYNKIFNQIIKDQRLVRNNSDQCLYMKIDVSLCLFFTFMYRWYQAYDIIKSKKTNVEKIF